MARIRTIKPEFWEDEKLADLPLQARLLFIGTWNFSDDFGVFPDSIKWIKAKIFPYDSLRENDVKSWLDALVKNRMLIPFLYEEKSYYMIRRFRSHQIIDKRYERSIIQPEILSKIPGLTDFTKLPHSEHIVNTPPEMEGKGNGNGKEINSQSAPENVEENNHKRQAPTFDQVHQAFVRNGGTREMAETFFQKKEAVGWMERGSEIRNFAALVPSFIRVWKENRPDEQATTKKMVL